MKVYDCVNFYLPRVEEQYVDTVISDHPVIPQNLKILLPGSVVPLFIHPYYLGWLLWCFMDNHSLTCTAAIIFSSPSLQPSTYILITWILLLFETVLSPKWPVEAASLNEPVICFFFNVLTLLPGSSAHWPIDVSSAPSCLQGPYVIIISSVASISPLNWVFPIGIYTSGIFNFTDALLPFQPFPSTIACFPHRSCLCFLSKYIIIWLLSPPLTKFSGHVLILSWHVSSTLYCPPYSFSYWLLWCCSLLIFLSTLQFFLCYLYLWT